VFAVLALLLSSIPFVAEPASVSANHTNIKWPFASGATWYISQGYNTSPAEGWSHYNCDPSTLKDTISQSQSCNQYYQYKYSFDLKRLDGNTAGQQVLSPVNGTIRWIDEAYGGMSINLGDGYAVAYFHTILASGLAAGQTVQVGQLLGTVAPAGQAGNGGTAHIHFTIWQTTDGGNWSRNAIPFTGDHGVDGYDFPALASTSENQHYQTQITSTNVPLTIGASSPPGVPQLISPATGTTYTTTGVTPTLTWGAVSGVTQYQVVVNNGSITSPWVSIPSWKMPALGTGQYAWQVKAKNASGESNLSAKWVFWVDPAEGGTTPTATSTPGTPGPLAFSLNTTSASKGNEVGATGTGFNPNETVNLWLDSTSSGSVKLATTTASGNGSFSLTFLMPEMPGGNHLVLARGVSSKKQPNATIKMNSTLARTPYQGPPGTDIAITVYGFRASETVKLNFDTESGTLLGNATTNANGTGTVNVKMPESTNGWHDYVGAGQTSGLKAYGALYVDRSFALSPGSGNAGTAVTVTAKGFAGSSAMTVGWNRTASVSGTQVCSGTTSSKGSYSCSFTVPTTTAGGYPVSASAGGLIGTATFAVLGPAAISVNPSSGSVGSNLAVNGGGFAANEQVRLNWDATSTAWRTLTADANGSVTWPATVPNLSLGSHTLNAKGQTSNKSATTTFSVAASGGNNGSSMISTGKYRVTATIEGLVGHTTSNGHVITPLDHFVSLPACTQTSCPWLTPGGSTYVAACGNLCFVKVINPATGKCSVAPIYDRGPWFINDNWWETPDKRYLNTRSGAVNWLAQGYTGADAARNGLDVGFGISNGIGISDVGYQVGNRAAIDIADGTWVDIGFAQSAGIGSVEVELLWQTGQSKSAAETACGQNTVPLTPALTLSPKTGPVGTTVQVTGQRFAPNESVKIYFATVRSTALATVKATSSGTISASIKIPQAAIGAQRIYGVGQTSGARAGVTFTITTTPVTTTQSFTLAPATGSPGTTVKITGKGFGANETVDVFIASVRNPAVANARTNGNGEVTVEFVMPDRAGGDVRIYVQGRTSALRAGKTFKVTPSIDPASFTGSARKSVTYQMRGFGANETVSFTWGSSSTVAASATTDATGKASLKVYGPWTGDVTGTVRGATSNLQATTRYIVTAQIKLTPSSGDGSGPISVRGTGFKAGSTVTIYWGSASSANKICSVQASSTNGAFTCLVSPKPGSAAGTYQILASGSGSSATANFTLTQALAAQAALDETTPETTPVPESTATVETEAESPAAATETPVEQTPVPTETATPEPTLEPVPREIVLYPVADTSVSASTPDQPQAPESATGLSAGGSNGDVALITFAVSGIAPGTVVNATLVMTGVGSTGSPGGVVTVAGGYVVDEASATYSTAPVTGLPQAIRADGGVSTIDWVDLGVEYGADVTGTVTADGTITFVISGIPDAQLLIGSRESGAPPRLVITVLDQPVQ
jgi:hypothetical protein